QPHTPLPYTTLFRSSPRPWRHPDPELPDFDVRLLPSPERTTRDGPAAVRGSPGNRAAPGEPGHDPLHVGRARLRGCHVRSTKAGRKTPGRRGESAGRDGHPTDAAHGTTYQRGTRNHFRLPGTHGPGV